MPENLTDVVTHPVVIVMAILCAAFIGLCWLARRPAQVGEGYVTVRGLDGAITVHRKPRIRTGIALRVWGPQVGRIRLDETVGAHGDGEQFIATYGSKEFPAGRMTFDDAQDALSYVIDVDQGSPQSVVDQDRRLRASRDELRSAWPTGSHQP